VEKVDKPLQIIGCVLCSAHLFLLLYLKMVKKRKSYGLLISHVSLGYSDCVSPQLGLPELCLRLHLFAVVFQIKATTARRELYRAPVGFSSVFHLR